MKIQIIEDANCPSCKKTKTFLDRLGIKYDTIDGDCANTIEVFRRVVRGMPFILVWEIRDGKHRIVDFWSGHSPMRLNKLTEEI